MTSFESDQSDEMNQDEDPYSPALASDAIRLFRLRTLDDGTISVHLNRFGLDSADRPPFVATSYVWGDPTYSDIIMVNGRRTPILNSAHGFFKAMRSPIHRQEFPSRDTWWWMDSICINQADAAERSAQVQLMSAVYKKARRTVIWLGEESEDSDRAMDFLDRLAGQDPRRDPSEEDPEIGIDEKAWKAVEKLLQREWWERVWTLQEFLMGTRAAFFCGQRRISRAKMFRAVNRVWDWQQYMRDILPRKSYEKAWNRFRLLEWYFNRGEMPLVGMMAYTATFRVTDPRDRLYSLLGLAASVDKSVVGQPDYQSDVGLVYTEFAKSFVENHQSLDIVCVASELGKDVVEQAGYGLNLPSWVPDWSLRRRFSPPVLCMASQSSSKHIGNFRPLHSEDSSCSFAASRDRLPRVSFSEDLHEMTCAGVLLDRIDGLGGVKQVRYDAEDLLQSTSVTNIVPPKGSADIVGNGYFSVLLEAVSRCLVLDRKDRYFRHPAPRQEFEFEFITLCQAVLADPESVYPTFRDWFQLNRDLLIRGVTLEDAARGVTKWYEKILLGLKNMGLESERARSDISEWEGFLSRSRDTTSTMGKRLVVTDTGLLGMAPRDARRGDVVCVLLGCSIPLVLRQVPGQEDFQIVGECFVDGHMDGEVLKDVGNGRCEIRDFRLVGWKAPRAFLPP